MIYVFEVWKAVSFGRDVEWDVVVLVGVVVMAQAAGMPWEPGLELRPPLASQLGMTTLMRAQANRNALGEAGRGLLVRWVLGLTES